MSGKTIWNSKIEFTMIFHLIRYWPEQLTTAIKIWANFSTLFEDSYLKTASLINVRVKLQKGGLGDCRFLYHSWKMKICTIELCIRKGIVIHSKSNTEINDKDLMILILWPLTWFNNWNFHWFFECFQDFYSTMFNQVHKY